MSSIDHVTQHQLSVASQHLETAEATSDFGSVEDFTHWIALLNEFKLAASASQLQVKSEHDIMSAAIQAIK